MSSKSIFKMIVGLLSLMLYQSAYASFFDKKAEGWHWYHDPVIELHEKEEEAQKNTPLSVREALTPTQIVKAYQKELEKKLHRAWAYPTLKNIQAYQTMQKDLTERSAHFADVWMKAVYQNPHLDHTTTFPVAHNARHLYLDQQKDLVRNRIKELSESYGLFFFFSSSCEYCHQFAPIVQQFSKDHDWTVLGISVDGGELPGFEAVPDRGFMQRWKVEALPALFAVNPRTQKVLPVSYGFISLEKIEERIMTLTKGEDL